MGLMPRIGYENANLELDVIQVRQPLGIWVPWTDFNYTMMGDMVNLAARCESGAKAYGAYIMITEETKIASEKTRDDNCI